MIRIKLLDDIRINVTLEEVNPLNAILLDGDNYIKITLYDEDEVGNIELETSNSEIETTFDIGTVLYSDGFPLYEGPYVAVPRVVDQDFETNHKSLIKDFKVKEITYLETSNAAGGITATIGEL